MPATRSYKTKTGIKMTTLYELGHKHGTDKRGHGYLQAYERLFDSFRYDPIVLLEIGVASGASLRMWKEYFPKGLIVGLDIEVATAKLVEERIEIMIGNQNSSFDLGRLVGAYNQFDVIVDDASHQLEDQVFSFEYLWPHVKLGGYYAIEDIPHVEQTNRWKHFRDMKQNDVEHREAVGPGANMPIAEHMWIFKKGEGRATNVTRVHRRDPNNSARATRDTT
jgi:hypothetical protein